ncbi:MAG: lysophospholipid acyltransferase family protein, partial [Saprospiraceae bacterium]
GLAFLLHRVIGYRKQVALEGLRRSFPEKTEPEIQEILRKFYRNLTDVTLETIKSNTMTLAELDRRCPVRNPERINQYLDAGQSIILTGAHFNNWEYAGFTIPTPVHGVTTTAYKPLTNKLIDNFINRNRARAGMQMVSMEELFGAMRRQRNVPTVYILVADQSPSSRKSAHWVNFLGQPTAALPGADVLARKFGYPVLHFHVRRLQRGFYEVEHMDICLQPATAAEGDITRSYSALLETNIRLQPESWLWSHKRWKMKPAVETVPG